MRQTFKFIKTNKVILSLLSLALTSCSMNTLDEIEKSVQSGPPTAEFIVKGKVVTKSDGKVYPVEGIEVVFVNMEGNDIEGIEGDTIYTDNKGKFEMNFVRYPSSEYRIKFTDTRGVKNSLFIEHKEDLIYNRCDFTKGSGAYLGINQRNMGMIELESLF